MLLYKLRCEKIEFFLSIKNIVFLIEEAVIENIHKNIRSNADIILKIWDFLNFYIDIHDSIGCQKPVCRLEIYCDVLSGYLKREDKTDDEKKALFHLSL